MTGREGLAALAEAGLFPAEALDDLMRTLERVQERVERGELTEAQGEAICNRHAARMVEARERTQGRITDAERKLAGYIIQAIDAKGQA